MFTNHIFEWQIQRIFDYFGFSVKGDQHFEIGFSNFHSAYSLYEIISYSIFTSLSKEIFGNSVQNMHVHINE